MKLETLAERVEICTRLLREAVERAGLWMSGDGRVGEEVAAKLLGWNVGALRNARSEGSGPRWYRLGGGGAKITYRIVDIAEFIEERAGDI